jgi:hypothetical protein
VLLLGESALAAARGAYPMGYSSEIERKLT